MKTRSWWLMSFTPVLASLIAGCPTGPPPGTLDSLEDLPDADGDSFGELENCTDADDSETVAIAVVNEITRDEAEAFAVEMFAIGVPPALLDTVGVRLDFTITRVYDGGECVDEGSRQLNPFEFRVEAACPTAVRADVNVVATIPIVGPQVVFTQQFETTQDDALGFACGRMIMVRAFLNEETGAPDAEIEITDP
ncbi:MAG: hypothetical protein HOP29_03895 [Phycisphaerales bacterium]|nr:hypothetical protein [Phycisphaerales bacterium]